MRFALLAFTVSVLAYGQPFRLHPANPHYFEYKGKPTVLITSGEHYGAVLNLDFNYPRYLETLKKDGLNHTRTFVGNYREVPGSFNIERNSLAPAPARFSSPWPRSGEPGGMDGLNKFDLSKWNDAHFKRLKDFVRQAAKRGIIVEINLFCPFYEEVLWQWSPMNARNNVNGIGQVKREEVYTLKDEGLTRLQDGLVRKIVSELRPFDNLYYEIANEPYFGGITLEWQAHIARVIREADGERHLISQNIANGSKKVEKPDPLVSIFNFHYSRPPESVAMNYSLGKALGNNETGFDGTADATYRIQGWDFIIAGGALYNNLDYSFVAGQEDGTFQYPEKQPGGGTPALRKQLGGLKRFVDSFDLVKMSPAPGVILEIPEGASARALAETGRQYAIYIHHGRIVKDKKPQYQVGDEIRETQISLDLPAGEYKALWVDTKTGAVAANDRFTHGGGKREFASPRYREDIALKISR
ncbi:MAG TPA: DUF6298 domain-containing protein [Bryobacteraceae bacterium]|nr:DUF6298 domain-containing protein [Bryobacteraceae bacterium]